MRYSFSMLDIQKPLVIGHPLNISMVYHGLNIPAYSGGSRCYSLTKNYPGTLSGSSVSTLTPRPGGMLALGFNGSSNYASLGNITEMNSLSQGISIACWIYPRALADFRAFLSKFNSSTDRILLTLGGAGQGGNDDILFGVANTNSWAGNTSGNFIATNTWYHIVATFNFSTGTGAIYINGISRTVSVTGTAPTTGPNNTSAVILGARDSATNFVNTLLDDVRIYQERVLNANEAAMLYIESYLGYPNALRFLSTTFYSIPNITPPVVSAFRPRVIMF